jgi:hypothetical protein
MLVTHTALGWESSGSGTWPSIESARVAASAQPGDHIAAIYLLDKDDTE